MSQCAKCGKKSLLLVVDKNGECNDCALESAKEKLSVEMDISKIVTQQSGYPLKYIGVAIDGENKKIAISVTNNLKKAAFFDFKVYNFDDIVSVDVVEDGSSVISGNAGATLIGGMLLGGVGALAGAAKKKKVKKVCSSLGIEIRFDSLDEPVRVIEYIGSSTKTDSWFYKEAVKSLKEIYDILNYVVIQNNKQPEQQTDNQSYPIDEIRKYKALFDDGIITQEEFEAKKKQLLGI